MPPAKPTTLDIDYKFTFKNGTVKEVPVKLDIKTLTLIAQPRASYPAWTKLAHSQCPNCPLNAKEHPRCPIAANLVDLIGLFKRHASYEKVLVEVTTPERKYSKETSIAEGISPLVGIYMVSSGCPILDKLKPMVRTHLPFSSWEETIQRMLSIYLLAQYFRYRAGQKPDWTMDDIRKIAADINVVNQAFCGRLQELDIRDAALNAVVQLDCFANLAATFVMDNRIEEMKSHFDAYLK